MSEGVVVQCYPDNLTATILCHVNERTETLGEGIARVVKEGVAVAAYDPRWPVMFEQERLHVLSCLSAGLQIRLAA